MNKCVISVYMGCSAQAVCGWELTNIYLVRLNQFWNKPIKILYNNNNAVFINSTWFSGFLFSVFEIGELFHGSGGICAGKSLCALLIEEARHDFDLVWRKIINKSFINWFIWWRSLVSQGFSFNCEQSFWPTRSLNLNGISLFELDWCALRRNNLYLCGLAFHLIIRKERVKTSSEKFSSLFNVLESGAQFFNKLGTSIYERTKVVAMPAHQ